MRTPGSPTLRFLAGLGLGWIVLPLVVVTDDAARVSSGTDSIAPVVADAMIGGATGLLIGAGGLGRAGLIGAVGGAMSGALVPYLAIPPLVGIHAPDISSAYGTYATAVVATLIAAATTTAAAARSRRRVSIRPVLPIVIGLLVISLWFAFWLFWAVALSPRLVSQG